MSPRASVKRRILYLLCVYVLHVLFVLFVLSVLSVPATFHFEISQMTRSFILKFFITAPLVNLLANPLNLLKLFL